MFYPQIFYHYNIACDSNVFWAILEYPTSCINSYTITCYSLLTIDCCDSLSISYLPYMLCLVLLSGYLIVRWLIMMVMVDGDEKVAMILINLLKVLDELPSWRDGVSPHSCP